MSAFIRLLLAVKYYKNATLECYQCFCLFLQVIINVSFSYKLHVFVNIEMSVSSRESSGVFAF